MRAMLPSTQPHRRLTLSHLLRLLSTSTSNPIPTPTPPESNPTRPPPTKSHIRAQLRRETDPDRALSFLSSLPSATSADYKHFVYFVSRRLSNSFRHEDAAKLLDSCIPRATAESDFASLLASYGAAFIPDRALSAFTARIADGSLTVSVLSFNALLSAFRRSGQFRQIPHLFTSLSEEYNISPNDVSYSILIKSLCLSRKVEDALALLKVMREEKGINPTPSIYVIVLNSLYKLNKFEEAELVWNEMVERTGCKPDDAAYNARICYYAIQGETDKVLELIKEMETAGAKPNTITYNFLLICHFKNEHWEDAKKVYEQVFLMKFCAPNAATFRILLGELSRGRDFETGLEVFSSSLKKNKVPEFATVRIFVEGLVKHGKADRAKAVIEEVRKRFPAYLTDKWKKVEKDLGLSLDANETASDDPTPAESNPTTPPPTKNTLRAHLLRETDPDRALALLSSLSSSLSSTSYKFSVDYVASLFSLSSRFDDAAKLLGSRIPHSTAESDFAFLLTSYGRASIPDHGLSAFKARVADDSLTVSVLSFNALLSAFCLSGLYDQVPHLFTSLSEEYNISPDVISYLMLIKSLGHSGQIEDALVTLKLMKEEKGISPTPAIYGTVLTSLYKLNKPERAELLWNEMVETGCKPDNALYNARISYHANRAETDKVQELIKEMETAGVQPNTISYNFLIKCHFKNECWELAKTVYEQIFAKKVCAPNGATIRILLDGFSRSGDFETGLEVLFKSLKKNKVPDLTALKTFVEGLVKDGKVDQAKTVVVQVRKMIPTKSTNFWKQVEKDLGLSSDADAIASDGIGGA